MRRGVSTLLSLAVAGCGARTGLVEEFAESGVEPIADAQAEVGADAEMTTEAGTRLCPLRPPARGTTCAMLASSLECAYLRPPRGIDAWCCEFGGWVNCTTVADTTFTTCEDLLCTPDVSVECIIRTSFESECCTCGDDSTVGKCGPC